LDFLNNKVGTDMAEKEPKSTSGHSCLESHERLNVIGSPNFRCFVGLSCCGSGFSLPVLASEVALMCLLCRENTVMYLIRIMVPPKQKFQELT
jgi:hypothetical protein